MSARHQIIICTSCRRDMDPLPRGEQLIARLQAAVAADPALASFQVTGTDCMSGCPRPATVAFRAEGKASYLFGDIDPEAAPDDIITFARLYGSLADGWITDTSALGRLRTGAIARIPATSVVPGKP